MGACICCVRRDQDGEEVVSSGKDSKGGQREGNQSQMTMVQSDAHLKQHYERNDGEEVHL